MIQLHIFRNSGVLVAGVVVAGVLLCARVIADAPPPDDAFIEFLGADDVGDVNLMEYLDHSGSQRAPPPTATPPAPAPASTPMPKENSK